MLLLAAIDWHRPANQPARKGLWVALVLGRPFDLGLQSVFCIAECDAINFGADANKISSQDIPSRHLETFPCLDIGRRSL
jgi:hypothetical protein